MILWLNPVTGLSGDMLLGALIGLGAPLDGIRQAVASTGLTGWELDARPVLQHGLRATRAIVTVHDTATHRTAGTLLSLTRAAGDPADAALATRAVELLARTEARLHGRPDPEEVHLHELGGHDTVVDTVGVAAGLRLLGVDRVLCAPLALGTGTVGTEHGELPVPAPATAEMLTGLPVRGAAIPAETVTPTGAALLRAAGARGSALPPCVPRAVGYGAGTRALPDRPNTLQALLCAPLAADAGEPMALLETNVDDTSGEMLAHAVHRLLDAGAADAWVSPVVMKKGRPAQVVHLVCEPGRAPELQELLLSETGSLGVRRLLVDRAALPRTEQIVQVEGHGIRVKVGPWTAKPEYDDVAAAAGALGRPAREIAARALASLPSRHQEDGR
ncbi:nickel pincer cofactor biosynthesis protein LarC [Streptomyces sp. TR1341]|uniref:nickel pincer cofactor biosynthesis protein LarC n=1 Tax=Streptomyces sp. TR1341 TaxID=2601266 RepID=UPI00138ADBBD|nr:nickel pincer cofactor biosynthesis protein LarC [Streptomyces sp. TR1341]